MIKKIAGFLVILLCISLMLVSCIIRDEPASQPSIKPIATPTPTPEPTAFAEYPETIIQWMIPFGAGTNVDAWSRAIGNGLADQLGWRIDYTNISGGLSGSTGTYKVFNSRHDGYMFLGVGERSLTVPIYIEGELTAKDWVYFIAGGSPSLLCVSPDIGLESIQEFIMAAQNVEPDNELTVAVCGGGLQAALPYYFVTESGIDFNMKSYDTEAQAKAACINAEVDAIILPATEVAAEVSGRQLLALAVMDDKDLTNRNFYKNSIPSIRGTVPELKSEALDALRQFRGFALPADTSEHILLAIQEGFLTLNDNAKFNNFVSSVYGNVYLYIGEEAADHAAIAERYLCWILSDMQRGGYTPDYVDIERPY